ncbi:hypothetical protein [Streptomyces sp. NPDC059788]|uniref:hypothetical protein n=1 Tax=Streptomyces sp. NPDC059788 TaxID=3346948 RepID=UPI0036470907
MQNGSFELRQITSSHAVDAQRLLALIGCWVGVTHAGEAAGFPFPPIDAQQAAPATSEFCQPELAPPRASPRNES